MSEKLIFMGLTSCFDWTKQNLRSFSHVLINHFNWSFILLVVVFLFSTFSPSFAQIPWTKDANNPVLSYGLPGSWEPDGIWGPFVLKDVDTLKMWYTGSSGSYNRIGYATSSDGVNWGKFSGNPVLDVGQPGSWDAFGVADPYIIFDGTTYQLWYGGAENPTYPHYRIGIATSPDGIIWTKADSVNPVLDLGLPGSWDCESLWGHSYYFDGSIYHMWYAGGFTSTIYNRCIGYATSPDGINWTKHAGNPVFCGTGSWAISVWGPHVIVDGSNYKMWYSGYDGQNIRIGYVTSSDGISWVAAGSAVLDIGEPGKWDDNTVGMPSIFADDTTYHMWYYGRRSSTASKIGYANAPVTINVPADVPTIQAAIDSASDGNLVLVADGTYQENINFKGKAITVASHYYFDGDTSHISNTIIDGSSPSDPDSGSVVSFVSGEDTTSVLYGFTITNGSGTITEYTWGGVVYPIRIGGGIICYNSGARIWHNKIMNNHIPYYIKASGGGVAGYPNGSSAHVIIDNNQIVNNSVTGLDDALGSGVDLMCNGTLINNVISHNTSTATGFASGGIICGSELSPRTVVIKNNHIMHNAANGGNNIGGGVSIGYETNVSVIGNEISYNELNSSNTNRGAGIYVTYRTGTTIIDRNTITNNMVNVNGYIATGGGISLYENNSNSNTLITNNIIFGNSAIYGGGIHNQNSVTQIINNTIVNNTATNAGGGIRSTGTNPVVLNTIAWGNQAGFDPQISGSVDIQYSDVEGGALGIGNINSDPLFADTLLYNLSDSSLCIGAGIDSIEIGGTWYYAPPFDFDGDPRPHPVDMYVDIGAQESQFPPTGIIKEDFDYLPKTFSLKQNYPNPFNPTTNIEFSIPKSEFVTLKVFNILGQEVVTLVSDKLTPGNYKYTWDASDLASGVYMYKIEAGHFVQTHKLILMK